MIKTVSYTELVEAHCKAKKLWAVMVFDNLSLGGDDDQEDEKVWNFLENRIRETYGDPYYVDLMFAFVEEKTFMFTTQEEAGKLYDIFCERPVYASGMYAALVSPTQGTVDCNT